MPKCWCSTCSEPFEQLSDLRVHHKSRWHHFNLQRQVNALPKVSLEEFTERIAKVQVEEKAARGQAHLKRLRGQEERSRGSNSPKRTSGDSQADYRTYQDPALSLFDWHRSASVEANVKYMSEKFSFSIPDPEYLTDVKSLLMYLGAKLFEGHQCLYCNKPFESLSAARKHMIAKGHTSVGVDSKEQREELEDFYDFSESYKELNLPASSTLQLTAAPPDPSIPEDLASEDEWETLSTDEAPQSSKKGRSKRGGHPDVDTLLTRSGLHRAQLNTHGNLVLPSGVEAAHRSVAYIYRQRLPVRKRPGHEVNAPSAIAGELSRRQQKLLALTKDEFTGAGKDARAYLSGRTAIPHHRPPPAYPQARENGLATTTPEPSTALALSRVKQVFYKNKKGQEHAWRRNQRIQLRLGVKANKLCRIIRRSEKYFL